MVVLEVVFAAAFGLVFGSFANVLIYRVPLGERISWPPSHCTSCDTTINWYLNVPVLSWIFLRGKCAACGARISPGYPLVESAMGAFFVLNVLWWGLNAGAAAGCAFSFLCIVLGLIDLEHHLLPDLLTYPGIAAGILFSPFVPWTDFRGSIIGILVGAALPGVLIGVYALFGIDAMGWGDVKFLAMIGAFLGWQEVLLTILLGSLLGSLVGGAYLAATRKGRRTPLPFGTFLSAATICVLFFGPAVWAWYVSRLTGLVP